MLLLLGYTCFVVSFSVFTINWMTLRVAEDLFLLCFAAFVTYLIVLDKLVPREGQFLVDVP